MSNKIARNKPQPNTPQLWDEIWKDGQSQPEDLFGLAKEEHSIRWQRVSQYVQKYFGSFENLRVIEIGAGAGTYAALMAKRRADVTVLDYSDKALQRAQEFFSRNSLSTSLVNENALALPQDLLGKFDISMSYGLTEHFKGPDRLKVNQAHFDVLKGGGISFISVPNRYNPPYRLFKFVAERVGKWTFGEEYAYSHWELKRLCKQIGVEPVSIFGDYFFSSFNWINPFKASAFVRQVFHLHDNFDINSLRNQQGTPLDGYFSYSLVLCARKPLAG